MTSNTRDSVKARLRGPFWATTRALLRPTASMRVLPDYLVIGGQRCGTTSLQQVLMQHPTIASARLMKGVHFFDTGYGHGLDWYRTHFPTRAYASFVERRRESPLIVGEASPYYIFHPLSLERILHDLPGVKLIALLRDPVERAISHHKHEVRRGNETLPLAAALDAEEERLAGEVERVIRERPVYNSTALQTYSYMARGRYAVQVRKLYSLFNPSQVLILQSERFFDKPEGEYRRVLEFLEAPSWTPPTFPKANATLDTSVDPSLRQRLVDTFASSNDELFEVIGERFDWQ